MDTRRNTIKAGCSETREAGAARRESACTRVELLAPAGSVQTLQAVIEAGADAVYIGGARFGARAYADNPEEESLLQAIDYAHLRGVKVYLTVNTLLTDREMSELYDYINPYYMAGLDAVIVQDIGVLSFLRSHFPKMPVHISTQMTVTDATAATLWDDGVTRIVPARELSLAEIRSMRERCDRELEVFAHGALCYCYSGQCLLSSLIGGRSGNRGRCAQPCRKMYTYEESDVKKQGYLLSPKDQCLLPRLHELLETGIHSLKLEGRMKSLAYAAGVTAVYRKWIDRFYELGSAGYRSYLKNHSAEMAADVERLAELFNRGGFSGGYVFGEKGPDMMCINRPNHTGVKVGTAVVSWEEPAELRDRSKAGRTPAREKVSAGKSARRPVAIPNFTAKIGPGEVLELRTADERYVCGEWTTPRDMDGYRIGKIPVLWKKEYGRMPDGLILNLWRMKKEPLLTELTERYGRTRTPVSVTGTFTATVGKEAELSVSLPGKASVTVTGPVIEAAEHAVVSPESVREKLTKTGGSDFAFAGLNVETDGDAFLPVSMLKQMRREALEKLTGEILAAFRREAGLQPEEDFKKHAQTSDNSAPETLSVVASVMTAEQAKQCAESGTVTELYIDMEGDYRSCLREEYNLPVYLLLPRALKGDKLMAACREAERIVREKKLSGIVVRTADEWAYLLSAGIPIHADRTLYCHNSTAVESLLSKGFERVTLSEELRRDELPLHKNALITVYGRSVVMVSEQCPRKTLGLCGKKPPEEGILTDGEGAHFPAKPVCAYCHGLVYNSRIFSLLGDFKEIPLKGLSGIRIDFSFEQGEETASVLRDVKTALAGGTPAREGTTKGSFHRGTE